MRTILAIGATFVLLNGVAFAQTAPAPGNDPSEPAGELELRVPLSEEPEGSKQLQEDEDEDSEADAKPGGRERERAPGDREEARRGPPRERGNDDDRPGSGRDRGRGHYADHHSRLMEEEEDTEGARFHLQRGNEQIDITCAADDSTQECVDAVLPLLRQFLSTK